MSAVQFHCPLCTGLFQVDDALAGYQLNCPHCAGLVTVPSSEPAIAPSAAATMQLGCPLCTGQFQVTAEMAGQEVTCPHCYQVVGVPGLECFVGTSYASTSQSPPPPVELSREMPPSQVTVDPLLPPTGTKPDEKKTRSDKTLAAAATHIASHSIDSLLPPGATTAPAPTTHDTLLPPAAAATTRAPERVPLPASIPARPKDTVFIPTEKGLVGVHEPVRTVVRGGEEIELRKLSPEQKAWRRMIRNTLVFAACLMILILVFVVLSGR